MIFDFVFSKKELSKAQFFQWLIDEMIASGWENLSANKANVDHWTMFSTGESGNEKIGVQLRKFYSSEGYDFPTTVYSYISARAFHSYTASPSITKAGEYLPNQDFTNIRISNDLRPDENINVYYHINKDRAIIVVENPDTPMSENLTSMFFVLGKPYTIADYDEFCTSAVITSQGSVACRSGVVGYNSENLHVESTFAINMHSIKNQNNSFAKSILLSNTYDGYKYVVENIFVSSYANKTLTVDMRKNTFKDSEGRVYKQFVNNYTSTMLNSAFRSFIIRIRW